MASSHNMLDFLSAKGRPAARPRVGLPIASTLLLHTTTLCQEEEGITNSAIWCPIKWTSKLATSST